MLENNPTRGNIKLKAYKNAIWCNHILSVNYDDEIFRLKFQNRVILHSYYLSQIPF